MATFAHFPSELLSGITQALDGFDIANMYLTGNASLRARMESGGVTRFKLKLRQERNKQWPKLVSRFRRLEYLSIGPQRDHSIWFRGVVDLLGVSRSLKHLKLCFDNVEMILLGIPFVVEDLHPDPILSPSTDGEMLLSPLPIAKHFVELQTLSVIGISTIPHILVSHLPQTLLRLRLNFQSLNVDIFRSLPPQLTSLELPNLHKLEKSRNVIIFPLGLTTLLLPKFVISKSSFLSALPTSVTELNCFRCDVPDFWRLLPLNLVSLSIYWALGLSNDIFECLPRSVRHLKLKYPSDGLTFNSLPPGLQTLTAGDGRSFPDGQLALISQTITKLKLRRTKMSLEGFKILPPHLRSLALDMPISAPLISPYGFMGMLEKLEVLDLDPQALAFMPRLIKLEIDTFLGNDLSALKTPSRLRIIHILNDTELDVHLAQHLPASLQVLEMRAKNQVGPTVSQYLPQSLLLLRINGLSTVAAPFIEHLPPRLTQLIIFGTSPISDDSILLLPRTLQLLILSGVSTITDEGIGHLPHGLIECRFERLHLLTNKSAALFPRCLTHLNLNRCTNFDNEAVPHFPRTLTSLDISLNFNITSKCIPHLPPLLRFFRVKNPSLPFPWHTKVSPTSSFISSLIKQHEGHAEPQQR